VQVEPLLLALRQPPLIAQLAARYLHIVIPCLPMMAVRETVTRYLLTQQVAMPGLVVNIATVLVAPLYSYILLFRCGAVLFMRCSWVWNAVEVFPASLCRASLCRASLCSTSLCRASLCRASLCRASLCRALLCRASLCRALWRNADSIAVLLCRGWGTEAR
jgi:hypothetical protein